MPIMFTLLNKKNRREYQNAKTASPSSNTMILYNDDVHSTDEETREVASGEWNCGWFILILHTAFCVLL